MLTDKTAPKEMAMAYIKLIDDESGGFGRTAEEIIILNGKPANVSSPEAGPIESQLFFHLELTLNMSVGFIKGKSEIFTLTRLSEPGEVVSIEAEDVPIVRDMVFGREATYSNVTDSKTGNYDRDDGAQIRLLESPPKIILASPLGVQILEASKK